MGLRIHYDHTRFNEVIKGRIRSHLKEFIKNGEFVAKDGNEKILVPINRIELPHFRFLKEGQGGIGQGAGKNGQPITDKNNMNTGDSSINAGADPSEHALEAEVSLNLLADLLGEELGLPHIEKKRGQKIRQEILEYKGIHTSGPNALRHFRRTFKNALRRQIAMKTYDFKNPIVIPVKEDLRYRSFKRIKKPKSNAVIIYMMDVSGSMGDEQKEIVRIESFWIDTWLRRNYEGIECRYIIHDAIAKEVSQETFFHTRESGGTMISSCYRLCAEIIDKDYDNESWNIYPFHFSDGDNWSVDDTRLCIGLLRKRILPKVNQFSYGQVESPYGSGQFIKDLKDQLKYHEALVLSEIKDKDSIYQSIKDFLAQGK